MQSPFLPLKLLKMPESWTVRLNPRFLFYSPSVDITIETKTYTLTMAKTVKDLLGIFALRYNVFFGPYEERSGCYDIDEFDRVCDHLVVLEKDSGQIIATSRVLSSDVTKRFYAQTEFYLDPFLAVGGKKLEWGRVCVHRDHRNRIVIDLLWKAVAQYIKACGFRYLFGCSSVKVSTPGKARALWDYFKREGMTSDRFSIAPVAPFAADLSLKGDVSHIQEDIPPLLKAYLRSGAKLHGPPAFDKTFDCLDFFTILDFENLSPSHKRRYFGHPSP